MHALGADDLDQVVIGQHIGKTDHRKGHGIDIAREIHRDIVRQPVIGFEVLRQSLTHADFHVMDQCTKDIFRKRPFLFRQLIGGIGHGDLGGSLTTRFRRRFGQQPFDISLRERNSHFPAVLPLVACNAHSAAEVLNPR